MAVKIVTDSTVDLPEALIHELGITVVPQYLRFGETLYRDRVDITEDEFYHRLLTGKVYPKTAQPPPQDFSDVYQKLSRESEGIISVHLSNKLSGTYNSAVQGAQLFGTTSHIEVIDSQTVSIALGLIVIHAAKMANTGKNLQQITDEIHRIAGKVHMLILFDTLEYLAKGGRIGKAKAVLGSLLSIKPLLTVKHGEMMPAGQVRTRSKGVEALLDFVQNAGEIQDLAVLYNTTLDEARTLVEKTGSVFPKELTIISRVGPALGVHSGPGILAVALRQK